MNKTGSRESKSPWGQFTETVKEKLDTVRGRRYSKEQGERDQRPDSSEVSSRRSENVVFVLSGKILSSLQVGEWPLLGLWAQVHLSIARGRNKGGASVRPGQGGGARRVGQRARQLPREYG